MAGKMTFEKANEKLEKLVAQMESGELSLQESMAVYEEAFNLLNYCYEQLEACKGQMIDINTRIEAIKNREDVCND